MKREIIYIKIVCDCTLLKINKKKIKIVLRSQVKLKSELEWVIVNSKQKKGMYLTESCLEYSIRN